MHFPYKKVSLWRRPCTQVHWKTSYAGNFFFFFFRHWTSFNGWKLWPSQRHFSISLDPGCRLSNFWPSFGKCPVWRYPPICTWVFLVIFWLEDSIIFTWRNQLSLWALIWLTIFLCFISLSNSLLVLILHIWFSFVGPNILLKIFLSKTSNFWIMVSFSTHVSEAYVTIGLMTVLYSFNFELLVTNLLLKNFWFA